MQIHEFRHVHHYTTYDSCEHWLDNPNDPKGFWMGEKVPSGFARDGGGEGKYTEYMTDNEFKAVYGITGPFDGNGIPTKCGL